MGQCVVQPYGGYGSRPCSHLAGAIRGIGEQEHLLFVCVWEEGGACGGVRGGKGVYTKDAVWCRPGESAGKLWRRAKEGVVMWLQICCIQWCDCLK